MPFYFCVKYGNVHFYSLLIRSVDGDVPYLVIYLVQPHWQIIQPVRLRAQRTIVCEKAHPVVLPDEY